MVVILLAASSMAAPPPVRAIQPSKTDGHPPDWKCINTPGWKATNMDDHPEGVTCENYKNMHWCKGDGFSPGYEVYACTS